jgi:hypothetical protein
MSYIVLYFSIGLALAIVIYLYSCYDYRVNCRDWSWDQYVDVNDIYRIMGGVLFAYPLLLLILVGLGIRGCVGYLAEYVREWIFKIIDQHFVK